MKNRADPRCRICTQYEETIDHLISGCPTLAPNEYLNRHIREPNTSTGKSVSIMEPNMLKNGINSSQKPSQKLIVTILWDYSIQTDKKIKANKPHVTVKDKREKTCKLIDVKIPVDRNVSVAEFEKVSKYKDLEIEVEKLCHMKTVTIPVVIGALGIIKEGTEKYF